MSIKLMAAAWELDIPTTEKMVLLCLCDHASPEGVCWPSVPTIARKCSKGERTVQGAIKWLRDQGYCHWDDTPGKPHRFALDPRKICATTPAEVAPPQKLRGAEFAQTPAEVAPEPYITPNTSEAKASSVPRDEISDRVVAAWNSGPAAKGARSAKAMDPARKKALAARVREHGEPAVFEAIRNLAASPFHCGEGERSWRAHLGWLLEPKNFLKVLEMDGPAAKPADPAMYHEFCLRSAEKCRAVGREQEALDWEAKARGEEPRRASTGPPRQLAALLPDHLKTVASSTA